VKRSGKDEPIQVAIHMCMKAMLGICLYRYLYLKLAKTLCLSYYLLVFSSTKLEKQVVGVDVAQTMYTHVSKCKNDKIKQILKKTRKNALDLKGRDKTVFENDIILYVKNLNEYTKLPSSSK
jgi:hypothetical protein